MLFVGEFAFSNIIQKVNPGFQYFSKVITIVRPIRRYRWYFQHLLFFPHPLKAHRMTTSFHSDDFFKFQTLNHRANGRESEYLALAKQTHGLGDSTKVIPFMWLGIYARIAHYSKGVVVAFDAIPWLSR